MVPDIISDTLSMAARDTTGVAVRAVVFFVVARGIVVARGDVVVETSRVVAGRAVADRVTSLIAVRDVGRTVDVRDVPDLELRVVTLRGVAVVRDVVARDTGVDVSVLFRFVAFSSRTAASATPMHMANIPIKCRSFFISFKC